MPFKHLLELSLIVTFYIYSVANIHKCIVIVVHCMFVNLVVSAIQFSRMQCPVSLKLSVKEVLSTFFHFFLPF